MADDTSSPPPLPSLTLLQTLHNPSGTSRSWCSRPHPSPRTPLLATASSDRSVQIWNLRDFKLVSTINGGHKRSIRCVGWKDWGNTSATTKVSGSDSGPEKPVTLATGSFDANTGIWVYEPEDRSSRGVNGGMDGDDDNGEMDMSRDGEGGAAGGDDDEENWHFTTLLTGPDSEIKDLQFSPAHYGANLLATCSRDKSVWIWEEVDVDNEWETIAVLSEHTGDVKCVAWCRGVQTTNSEGEETTIGGREVLASGSYDDTIRLWRDVEEDGEWVCVAVVVGHEGTVWDLCWEGHFDSRLWNISTDNDTMIQRYWESRIISCSDDMTIRVWRRELSESEKEKIRERESRNADGLKQPRLPSIIRPQTTMENWIEEARLPQVHVRSVYAVDWSTRTGMVVSCGGDGLIAVYREVLDDSDESEDVTMNGTDEAAAAAVITDIEESPQATETFSKKKTRWTVVAMIEAAHDEFELNHVCWTLRRDKGKRWEGEEVLVSTGDDGNVRVWSIPDEIVDKRWKT